MPNPRIPLCLLSLCFLLAAGSPEPLRARTDAPRRQAWELHWKAITVHDLMTGQVIRRIPLGDATFSAARGVCRPDLLASRSGAMIVSSNAEPVLWRIDPGSFEVRRYAIELEADREKDFGFSALAWGPNEAYLDAVSSIGGTRWRIDLATGTARKLGGGAWC